MKKYILSLWLALYFVPGLYGRANSNMYGNSIPVSYNVVWNSPSADAWESMPLSGRYGTGANVWVQDGSLWLYLAHNAAYDEDSKLLKLGALRITPANHAFSDLASFSQKLDLASGAISIHASSRKGSSIHLKLWFAGDNLIIESASPAKTSLELSFGSWRDKTRDSMYLDMGKKISTLRADHVNTTDKGLVWYHRNADYPSELAGDLKKQPFAVGHVCNPADDNVFGGAIVCNRKLMQRGKTSVAWQRWKGAAWTMDAAAAKTHLMVVALRAGQGAKPDTWLTQASSLLHPQILKKALQDEVNRWAEFWGRSYIVINPGANPADSAWTVGRNYQLFRYMQACNREGKFPLLFNGGIFTTDNFDKIKGNNNNEIGRTLRGPSTPDMRHWLFCHFMAQNERWLGWPTILAGDKDLLEQSNAFYRMHYVSAAARARGLGAEGGVYPEPIKVWGLSWNPQPSGLCAAQHLNYDFSMMIENAWMTLCGYSVLGKDIRADMEWIKGVVRFYDSFYRKETKRLTGSELDSTGHLRIYPANAIELLVKATNPIEAVAGLHRICDALTKLPSSLVSDTERAYFANVLRTLPELPKEKKEGKLILKPADAWQKEYNKWELPELYAAWPYRMCGVTHPGTEQILRNTWNLLPKDREEKVTRDYSWMPVVVNMAAMGDTDEAVRRVVAKLGNFNPQCRFPAFFGPGHDWVPDHNWGGSGMVGLQEMLMAANPYGDGKIYLLPAWPTKWNVNFKLHAPQNTVVEGSVKNGRVVILNVTPASRKKDIVLNPSFRME